MTYWKLNPIGYYTESRGRTILKSLDVVKGLDHAQLRALAQGVLDAGWHEMKERINEVLDIHVIQMYSFKNTEEGVAFGQTIVGAGVRLMVEFFRANNMTAVDISVPRYRTDPSMYIDDLILEQLGQQVSTTNFTITKNVRGVKKQHVAELFALHIQDLLLHVQHNIGRVGRLIYAYLNNRLFDATQKHTDILETLDQFDWSLYCHLSDRSATGDYGWCTIPDIATDLNSIPITPSQDTRPEVAEMGSRLRDIAQEGPKHKFLTMVSNGDIEDLIFFMGPTAPEAVVARGHLIPIGDTGLEAGTFVKDFSFPWDTTQQMTRIYKRILKPAKASAFDINVVTLDALNVNKNGGSFMPLFGLTLVQSHQEIVCKMVFDDISLKLAVDPARSHQLGRIAFRHAYFSKSRDRWIFENHNDDNCNNEWLFDRATKDLAIVTSSGMETLQTAQVGALLPEPTRFGNYIHIKNRLTEKMNTLFQVWHFRRGVLTSEMVSFSWLFMPDGLSLIKGAFCENRLSGIEDLLIERPKLEEMILGQLGLMYLERTRSQLPVRYSLNYAIHKTLFNVDITLPVASMTLENYIRVTC